MNQRLLVVSPTPFLPSDAGNRIRIANLLTALKDNGVEVYFLHVAREQGDANAMAAILGAGHFRTIPYSRLPRQETIAARAIRRVRQFFNEDARHVCGLDDWYDPAITEAVLNWHIQVGFTTVMVEYVFFSSLFEHLPPKVLKVLDTHDRFTLRHRLYLAQGLAPRFFSTTAIEEARGLSRADIIIAIQESERDEFSRMSSRPVINVGHLVRINDCSQVAVRDRPRLLIVGSENEINVNGLKRFLREDWPAVKKCLPLSQLLVAGGLSRHVPPSDDILALGVLADIADAYRQAHIVINPVRSGTGLNIKSIEALGFAMPLISTTAGSRGLETAAGQAFLLADSPECLAQAAVLVWQDMAFAKALSIAARIFAEEWNRIMLDELQKIIREPNLWIS
jgi:polysaccharide biosynthesis protein PslH